MRKCFRSFGIKSIGIEVIWHKVVWIEVDWYNEYEIKDYENDFRFNVSPNSTDDTTAHV